MVDQLLVLGQIPGTNFQITFNQMIALACLLILKQVWRRNPYLFRFMLAKAEFWAEIFKLRFRQPELLIGHRG